MVDNPSRMALDPHRLSSTPLSSDAHEAAQLQFLQWLLCVTKKSFIASKTNRKQCLKCESEGRSSNVNSSSWIEWNPQTHPRHHPRHAQPQAHIKVQFLIPVIGAVSLWQTLKQPFGKRILRLPVLLLQLSLVILWIKNKLTLSKGLSNGKSMNYQKSSRERVLLPMVPILRT